ncbi:hypothetical protein [Novosphingobium malaysiense]|uniref:Uncharacterized protein n=1 Tax=Novosphingobium malaysiense TaxID=1348853 RepID=A0A0B1ZIB1_9SPHN|nr:hypothetical protein [Novosphingobium malaysiense]KHK90247.1 hypothetical protein LK12_16485 [Novosphingobium malaysiense]
MCNPQRFRPQSPEDRDCQSKEPHPVLGKDVVDKNLSDRLESDFQIGRFRDPQSFGRNDPFIDREIDRRKVTAFFPPYRW